MKKIISSLALLSVLIGSVTFTMMTEGCVHDPFLPDIVDPVDTMKMDTMPVDTMPPDTTGMPCDPDKVYFERDVLPIFQSNCAIAGCHDAQTGEAGIMLNTYENVMATSKIEPFDLNDSELYEKITETDDDKRMPPPPRERLTAAQVQVIVKWILQGADNLVCDEAPACDTTAVSFGATVYPILETHCVGCHGTVSPNGGVILKTYDGVRTVALNGRLAGAITHQQGYVPMPYNLDQLPGCEIDLITAWINQGAQNN